MNPRIFPSEDRRADVPVPPSPRGTRVFRVTDRTIDQRTRLIIAEDAEQAVADDASAIAELSREVIHEVTECIELIAGGEIYRTASERVK
jgi:hypothetical protein